MTSCSIVKDIVKDPSLWNFDRRDRHPDWEGKIHGLAQMVFRERVNRSDFFEEWPARMLQGLHDTHGLVVLHGLREEEPD